MRNKYLLLLRMQFYNFFGITVYFTQRARRRNSGARRWDWL